MSLTGNLTFAGFTAPKLLRTQRNEPQRFRCIAHILLPKDCIVWKLTDVFSIDVSDASGMLLFDVAHHHWSAEMVGVCDVDPTWLPSCHESYEAVGEVRPA